MATKNSFHLMKRGGTTTGKTGDDDAKRYRWDRLDIIEAPKTEFDHLSEGEVETFGSEEKAKTAKKKALEK